MLISPLGDRVIKARESGQGTRKSRNQASRGKVEIRTPGEKVENGRRPLGDKVTKVRDRWEYGRKNVVDHTEKSAGVENGG